MADVQAIIAPVSVANTPAIITAASGTALAANPARAGWMIQNTGTLPLFILFGSGASATVFHQVLKGGAVAEDGGGVTFGQTNGIIYTGIITFFGTTPRFVVTELTK